VAVGMGSTMCPMPVRVGLIDKSTIEDVGLIVYILMCAVGMGSSM
jgi:hypothetical protein